MRDVLERFPGERLDLDSYRSDFRSAFDGLSKSGFWKLERRQTFQEPTSASWSAFIRGAWDEALELHESRRAALEKSTRELARRGVKAWWVRIVERPITPYLQWEVHLLRLRAWCGDKIRIRDLGSVEPFEEHGILPELVVLGDQVMYEILYDDDGLVGGGIRYTEVELIRQCRDFIQDLYADGVDVREFFRDEVEPLPPPGAEGATR